MPLSREWTGKIYGTNNGNIYLSIEERPHDSVSGRLTINDDQYGISVYAVQGTFNGSQVDFTGTPISHPDDVQVTPMEASGRLNAQGNVEGSWQTELGTAGTFWLVPHSHSVSGDEPPEQLFTARKDWGPVQISRKDIIDIAELIQKDFKNRVVVTLSGESEISCYVERFKQLPLSQGAVRVVKVRGADPERDGINRVVQVEFGPQMNFAIVQSSNEAWARGKKEMLAQHLAKFERNYATYFKRLGFGTNQLLFAATLITLPALPDWKQRILLMLAMATISRGLVEFDKRVLKFANIQVTETPRSPIRPSILSWAVNILGMVIAALVAAFIGGWLNLNSLSS